MKKILGTGLSGMLGTCITDILHDRYKFIDMSYDTGVDIRNKELLHTFIKEIGADIVLHLAAKADVEACEDDWEKDREILQKKGITTYTNFDSIDVKNVLDWREWEKENTAFSINVVGTYNVASVCKELGKKLILVSTDFVFDGDKNGSYNEDDEPRPVNHYSRTKYWSEQVVSLTMQDYIIVRPSFPYGTHHEQKKDFVRIIRERFEAGQNIVGITDQIITPTYSPEIAKALDNLITHEVSSNIFHIVGSDSLTSYNAVVAIAKQFGYDTQMIESISADEYYRNRAVRPKNLSMSNEKIKKRGVHFSKFSEGLKKIK